MHKARCGNCVVECKITLTTDMHRHAPPHLRGIKQEFGTYEVMSGEFVVCWDIDGMSRMMTN